MTKGANTSGTKPVSIKDVAKQANVSISTVSHVLNGTKTVSKPLQKRVMQAIEDLHYEVNMVARSLKSGKTNTIAVIVPSITSVFFPPLLKSIQTNANKEGYNVSVFGTSGDIEREKKYIQDLKSQWIDGILLSSCIDTSIPDTAGYIDSLSTLNVNGHPIPLICLESSVGPKLDAVVVDDENGTKCAVDHLLSLGRKQIAYISAPTSFSMGKLRRKGYLAALTEQGIPVDEKLMIEGDYSPFSGFQCMQQLLARNVPIDAVAVGNDQMAIGAMRAILNAGFRIPDDIAVIGYNDNFPSSLVEPSLSTVHVPKKEMGQTAFDLFIRRSKDPNVSPMHISLSSSLVIRNSTVPSVQTAWDLHSW